MDENTEAPASGSQPAPLGVAKPTGQPYINWYQAFRSSYRGAPQAPREMVRLAAAEWRGMSDEAQRPYREMAAAERAKPKPALRKDPKRLRTLRPRPVARPEEAAGPSGRRAVPAPSRKAKATATKAVAVKAKAAKRKQKRKQKRKPKRKQRRSRSRSPRGHRSRSRSRSHPDDSEDEPCCSDSDCSGCD